MSNQNEEYENYSEMNGSYHSSDEETNSDDIYYDYGENDIINEYYFEDIEHSESEKKSKFYYIGVCKLMKPENYYLLLNSVSPKLFFKYSFQSIKLYLIEYSIVYLYNPKVEIMQMVMIDDLYNVVLKTHWLRIVQRHWKKTFQKRKEITKKRCSIYSINYFAIHGKYPNELKTLPTIHGMLSAYKQNNNKNKIK